MNQFLAAVEAGDSEKLKELIHEKARGRHLRTLRDEEDEKVLEDVQEAFEGGSAGEQLRTTRASDRTFPITKGGSGGLSLIHI